MALLGFGVGGALLAGCYSGERSSIKAMSASGAAPAATQPHAEQVGIDNFTFSPATVTIAVGTKVTWVNHDDVPHTVTANDKRFSSKALDTDDQFSHVFSAPGTYGYFCAVHPHMTGRIIVK